MDICLFKTASESRHCWGVWEKEPKHPDSSKDIKKSVFLFTMI